MYVPGDNQVPVAALNRLFDRIGDADIVVHYVTNMHIRPLSRRMISGAFTTLVNLLFGLRVRYFNGTVIHRTRLLRTVPQMTDGFAYQMEILVRLLKGGATFVEVGCEMVERTSGSTSAFKPKNVAGVISVLGRLLWQTRKRRHFGRGLSAVGRRDRTP